MEMGGLPESGIDAHVDRLDGTESGPGPAGDADRSRRKRLPIRGCDDNRLRRHLSHRPEGVATLIPDDIVICIPEAVERAVNRLDAGEPFGRGDAGPTRHQQAHRTAVGDRQWLTVHGPDEHHPRIARDGKRQTAAHLGKVGALGNDVDGSGLDAGQVQDAGERNAFPDSVPDGVVAPRRAGRERLEAGASVPRALEKGLDLTRAEAAQLGKREGTWLFDDTGDVESPALRVDNGDWSVRADEEPIVGDGATVGGLDEIEWHAEVGPAIRNEPVVFTEPS